jgi:hypothetical protein
MGPCSLAMLWRGLARSARVAGIGYALGNRMREGCALGEGALPQDEGNSVRKNRISVRDSGVFRSGSEAARCCDCSTWNNPSEGRGLLGLGNGGRLRGAA